MRLMWIATFCTFFLSGLIKFIFTEMGKSENLSPFIIGNVNSLMYLGIIAIVVILGRWTFWFFSINYLIVFQLLVLPAVLFFVFFSNPAFYFAGAVLLGFLNGFTFLSSSSYSLMFEGKKDKYININESMVGLGLLLSGLIGLLCIRMISVKYSFLSGIVIVVGVVIIELVYYSLKKKSVQ